ncbi:MAG: hypothetical protein DRQ44_13120 [Gammaproteobacteria bacterium]|nr:MAG: hypothetical protein DRQ44_13120 [Gammaproteobacteria bacterium]
MKTRLVAAGFHFLGSVFVISLFLSVVYFIWYPKPFYIIHSVFDAVKIALIVDLVLGPFLTLVIFNLKKPRAELIRDMSIIVLFQIAALSWGVHITYKMRPVFFVFQDETFYSMTKEDINLDEIDATMTLPAIWQKPKSVYVEPLSSEEAMQRLDVITHGGTIEGIMYQAADYKPLSLQGAGVYMQDVLHNDISYEVLLKSRYWKEKVEKFLKVQAGQGKDYLFYSIENPGTFSGIIIYNKKDFSFAGLMD